MVVLLVVYFKNEATSVIFTCPQTTNPEEGVSLSCLFPPGLFYYLSIYLYLSVWNSSAVMTNKAFVFGKWDASKRQFLAQD